VRRLTRQQGLQARWKRKFVHTTDSRHGLPIADNILNRQFGPAAPNQAWTSDTTYIRTRRGWLYLCWDNGDGALLPELENGARLAT
jgi:putative transposase